MSKLSQALGASRDPWRWPRPGALARPYIANAAAKTATVWWTQGFVPEEDAAFKQDGRRLREGERQHDRLQHHPLCAADAEDRLGDDQRRRAGSDLARHRRRDDRSAECLGRQARRCHRRRRDAEGGIQPTRRCSRAQCYNNVKKKRGFYWLPFKTAVLPFHIWNSLVEKAGYKMADAPKTWDAFWDFFKPCRRSCATRACATSMRSGLQVTTTGPTDGNNMFHYFLIANGGNGHRHQGRQGCISTTRRSRRR